MVYQTFLGPAIRDCFLLISSGKSLSLLEELNLFRGVQFYYWGDLDVEGYIMLNVMRDLPFLTPAESLSYRQMAAADGRIEQERLDQEFVARRLSMLAQPAARLEVPPKVAGVG